MKQVYTKSIELISYHLSNRDFTLKYASSNRIKITCGKLKLSIMHAHLGCNDLFSTNTLLMLSDCVNKCHQNTETVRDQTHCSPPQKILNQ